MIMTYLNSPFLSQVYSSYEEKNGRLLLPKTPEGDIIKLAVREFDHLKHRDEQLINKHQEFIDHLSDMSLSDETVVVIEDIKACIESIVKFLKNERKTR